MSEIFTELADTEFVRLTTEKLGESPDKWMGLVIATDAITTLMVTAADCNVSAESAHHLMAAFLGAVLETPLGLAAVDAYSREC